MKKTKKRVIVANITWNNSYWRNIFVNPKAGHKYVHNLPGHECLNFDFNKSIDTKEIIHGYVQWTNPPVLLEENSVIIFYSKDMEQKGKIVGIYGGASIINPRIETYYKGFENDTLLSNLSAKKNLSMLFPLPLDSDKYSSGKRLVPQVGFTYKDEIFAERIILDEINALRSNSGIKRDEFQKLKDIYEFITGKEYIEDFVNSDELEQEEILEIDKNKDKETVVMYLKSVSSIDSETIEINKKVYKRDSKTIANIKIYRDFKCQICGQTIVKKDNGKYIEAAHIKPKSQKGNELPSNILILCPNHHKEFDMGKREIVFHDETKITFILNGKKYDIDLEIKEGN